MRRADARLACGLALAASLLSPNVHAFPSGTQFDDDPDLAAGGGGVHFTGSPGFAQAQCSDCHTDGALRLGVRVAAKDATIFAGGYVPLTTYEMQVALLGESLADENDGPPRCGEIAGKGFIKCNTN